jgi:hypothetical protein
VIAQRNQTKDGVYLHVTPPRDVLTRMDGYLSKRRRKTEVLPASTDLVDSVVRADRNEDSEMVCMGDEPMLRRRGLGEVC